MKNDIEAAGAEHQSESVTASWVIFRKKAFRTETVTNIEEEELGKVSYSLQISFWLEFLDREENGRSEHKRGDGDSRGVCRPLSRRRMLFLCESEEVPVKWRRWTRQMF